MRILAVDPGLTSGWALLRPDGTVTTGQSDFEAMMRAAERYAPTVVVCERYTITAETLRKSRQTTALELIGALRWMTVKSGGEFVMQSPADAKRFSTDGKLTSAGWLQPRARDHANDACRHLLLYCVKNKLMGVPR